MAAMAAILGQAREQGAAPTVLAALPLLPAAPLLTQMVLPARAGGRVGCSRATAPVVTGRPGVRGDVGDLVPVLTRYGAMELLVVITVNDLELRAGARLLLRRPASRSRPATRSAWSAATARERPRWPGCWRASRRRRPARCAATDRSGT